MLVVNNVDLFYGASQALRGVSLSAEPGKVTCLLGRNGVGKTSLTLHIAGAMAELGWLVLLIDMDQQANLTKIFQDVDMEGSLTINDVLDYKFDISNIPTAIHKTRFDCIYIIPADQRLRKLEARLAMVDESDYLLLETLNELKEYYDFILIDCPTGLGKPTRLALIASDFVIVPTECSAESVQGIYEVKKYITGLHKRMNPELKLLGMVINKYDASRSLEQSFHDQLREQFGREIFTAEFKDHVVFSEAMTVRMPITIYRSKSEDANWVRYLAGEIEGRIEKAKL